MDTKDINNAITELTSIYDSLNKFWHNDKCSIDVYQVFRQKDYKELYDKLEGTNLENIILGILTNSLNEKILTRLRNLLEENVNIYTTRQDKFTSIDFDKIYSLYENHLFNNKFALLQKDKEDIQAFTYPSEQEKEMLLKENQQEKNLLENERWDYIRANTWMLENYYTKIFDITQSFSSIINSYFAGEKEESIPTEKNNSSQKEEIVESQSIEIESDMIFRTNMYEKFLLLEKKLIADKYLNENLNWIAKNKKTKQKDIQSLIIFLVGLIDNRYFLPAKNSDIRSFFELRYDIRIGQNFEEKRRIKYLTEYSLVFLDYKF